MDALKDAGILIGLILSIFSIIGVIYSIAVWRTKNDTVIAACKDCSVTTPQKMETLKEQLGVLSTKMDLVWELQTAETLERQRIAVHLEGRAEDRLTDHQSPYKVMPKGEECLQGVLFLIDDLKGIDNMTASDVPVFVMQRLGKDKLDSIAKEKGCSVSEILALITVRMGFMDGG